jgi:hypothetical protein
MIAAHQSWRASPFLRLSRFFAVIPVYCSGKHLKPRQLVAPEALAKADRFRPARQLSIINLNLHARHFISPGWTNTVQPKLFFTNNAP